MTTFAPVPTGPAGPTPTGPAGPRPGGPPSPQPTSPKELDDRLFAAVDEILVDLQTPARRDPFSAADGADAIATPGGPVSSGRGGKDASAAPRPVQLPRPWSEIVADDAAWRPEGDTFSLPRTKPFTLAVGPLYDVLPGRSS